MSTGSLPTCLLSFSCRTALQNRLLRRRIHVFAGQQPIFLRHCLLHDAHCLRQQRTPIFSWVPTSWPPKTLTAHSPSIRTTPSISPGIRRVARLPSSVSLRSPFVLGVSLSRKGHDITHSLCDKRAYKKMAAPVNGQSVANEPTRHDTVACYRAIVVPVLPRKKNNRILKHQTNGLLFLAVTRWDYHSPIMLEVSSQGVSGLSRWSDVTWHVCLHGCARHDQPAAMDHSVTEHVLNSANAMPEFMLEPCMCRHLSSILLMLVGPLPFWVLYMLLPTQVLNFSNHNPVGETIQSQPHLARNIARNQKGGVFFLPIPPNLGCKLFTAKNVGSREMQNHDAAVLNATYIDWRSSGWTGLLLTWM